MSDQSLDLALKALTAVATVIAALMAWRAKTVSHANADAIREIKVTVDGRLSELLELTRVSARAAGVEDERQAQAGREATP